MSGGTRRALVIGNSEYCGKGRLKNARRDAEAIARKFTELGLSVSKGLDVGRNELNNLISDFGNASGECEAAVFFYAGHGLQVNGENYILPVDSQISREEDIPRVALSLNRFVLPCLNARVRVIFLDACRNNPFFDELVRSMSGSKRGGGRSADLRSGLAHMREAAAMDTFIAFATAPDSTADDGEGEHSPFTAALLEHVGQPNRTIFDIMGAVTAEVRRITANRPVRQTPWFQATLELPFRFVEPPEVSDREQWNLIKETKDPTKFREFIKKYPQSEHWPEAKARLRTLDDEEWADALREGSEPAFNYYLLRWPDGRHRQDASAAIYDIKLARELRDYEETSAENTIDAWEQFIEKYPDGNFATEARRKRLELLDDMAFELARRTNTRDALRGYRKAWPDGRHLNEAWGLLNRLAQLAKRSIHASPELRTVEACDEFLTEWTPGSCLGAIREDIGWLRARLKNSTEGYREYLFLFPGGKVDDAEWRLACIENTRDALRMFTGPGSKYREEALWRIVGVAERDAEIIEACERFLEACPDSPKAEEVRRLLDDKVNFPAMREQAIWFLAEQHNSEEGYLDYICKTEVGNHREEAVWRIAKLRDTAEAYEEYLRLWPDGRYAVDARACVNERTREDQLWSWVSRADTPAAPQQYLDEYPNGRYALEARQRLKTLGERSRISGGEPRSTSGVTPPWLGPWGGLAVGVGCLALLAVGSTFLIELPNGSPREPTPVRTTVERLPLPVVPKPKHIEQKGIGQLDPTATQATGKSPFPEARSAEPEAPASTAPQPATGPAGNPDAGPAKAAMDNHLQPKVPPAPRPMRATIPRPEGKPDLSKLPPIRVVDTATAVPRCVTATRLTEHWLGGLEKKVSRPNAFGDLQKNYKPLAAIFESQGEAMGVRWDFAYFYALVMTDYFQFGGRVQPGQNNFCGLGVGINPPGESFPSLEEGVRACLAYLAVVGGETNPVHGVSYLDRLKSGQERDDLYHVATGEPAPVTFDVFAADKLKPTDRLDATALVRLARKFYDRHCP
ncbi:MAG: caspase family protein [Hyphomicrobium sp.]